MISSKNHIIKINLAFKAMAMIVCVGVYSIFSNTFTAQVYILNGGFELSETVPNESGQWQLMNNWTNAGSAIANPDYYHTFGYNGGDLPETPLAYITAYSGYAIAGLEVSRRSGTNMREYLMGEFSEPLSIGKRYEFSFAVANGDVYEHSAAGLGVSDLGIAFSTEELVQTDRDPIDAHPQFKISHIQYYQGWKVIKFAFTASDKFKYFTFGLFGVETGKQIQSLEGPGRTKAYYFVDDFSIRDLTSELQTDDETNRGDPSNLFSLERSTFVPTAFSPNNDNINDVFEPSLRANRGALLRIFDRNGAMIWESTDQVPNWGGYSQLGGIAQQGLYLWTLNVVLEDGSVEKLSGPVTLLK
jgi:gliding motility-associated-like protein